MHLSRRAIATQPLIDDPFRRPPRACQASTTAHRTRALHHRERRSSVGTRPVNLASDSPGIRIRIERILSEGSAGGSIVACPRALGASRNHFQVFGVHLGRVRCGPIVRRPQTDEGACCGSTHPRRVLMPAPVGPELGRGACRFEGARGDCSATQFATLSSPDLSRGPGSPQEFQDPQNGSRQLATLSCLFSVRER